MSLIESVAFVLLFILPYFFCTISSADTVEFVQYGAFIAYAVCFIIKPKYLRKVFSGTSSIIVSLYFAGVVIKFLFYGKFSMMGALMPIVGLYGYYYINSKRIRLIVFDALMIGLYIFYMYSYFFKLDGVFFRTQLDNEGNVFGLSSSNAIPIILINALYIYQVVAYLQNESKNGLFLLYSTINLFFIFVQQSRSGIIIGSVFFIYNLYIIGRDYKSKIIKTLPWIVTGIMIFFFVKYGAKLTDYTDQLGPGGFSYSENRGIQVFIFYEMMDLEAFLLGYPPGTIFGNETYVFNTFLNQWNIYTLLGFCTTVFLLINRFVYHKKYFFPWYFLIPFLLYSFSEPRYLPNYWDFFIYLMLLKKAQRIKIPSLFKAV